MADLIVTTKFSVGDKAIISKETSNRMVYYIAKVTAIKNVVPDVDDTGKDIITYSVELFSPTATIKVKMDVLEDELQTLDSLVDTFTNY